MNKWWSTEVFGICLPLVFSQKDVPTNRGGMSAISQRRLFPCVCVWDRWVHELFAQRWAEMGGSIDGGTPIAGWFTREIHLKMDDPGVPPFQDSTNWWGKKNHVVPCISYELILCRSPGTGYDIDGNCQSWDARRRFCQVPWSRQSSTRKVEMASIFRGWDWCPNGSHHPTLGDIIHLQQIFGKVMWNKSPNSRDINPNALIFSMILTESDWFTSSVLTVISSSQTVWEPKFIRMTWDDGDTTHYLRRRRSPVVPNDPQCFAAVEEV